MVVLRPVICADTKSEVRKVENPQRNHLLKLVSDLLERVVRLEDCDSAMDVEILLESGSDDTAEVLASPKHGGL